VERNTNLDEITAAAKERLELIGIPDTCWTKLHDMLGDDDTSLSVVVICSEMERVASSFRKVNPEQSSIYLRKIIDHLYDEKAKSELTTPQMISIMSHYIAIFSSVKPEIVEELHNELKERPLQRLHLHLENMLSTYGHYKIYEADSPYQLLAAGEGFDQGTSSLFTA